ncbi:MAG: HNH endonuclease signature motif containing protein, partial [Nocardioides sp.]
LVLRDRHCTFPGCRRPPIACDAHHIQHWADGGPTSLDNLMLLCRAHHTVLHTTSWDTRINPGDRRPEFRPPPGRHRTTPELRATLTSTRSGDAATGDGADWVRGRTPRP